MTVAHWTANVMWTFSF